MFMFTYYCNYFAYILGNILKTILCYTYESILFICSNTKHH